MEGSAGLVATALVMGLVGSPHCAGMCGAACAGILRQGGAAASPWHTLLVFHLARVLSYALGGAAAAGSVAVLKGFSEHVTMLRPFWVMAQVGVLVLGVWLLWRGRAPRWPVRAAQWQAVRGPTPARARGAWLTAGTLGALWVAWPCGLLHSALLVAAVAPGPAGGATVMAAFAAASAAALSWGLWTRPARAAVGQGAPGARAQAWGVRLSGLLLVASTAWSLWHGVQAAAGFC